MNAVVVVVRSEAKFGVMAEEVSGAHAMYLSQIYERHAPIVRERTIAISEDVPFLKHRRFKRLCDRYLSLPREAYTPKQSVGHDDKTRKREWQQMRDSHEEAARGHG